MKYTCNDLSDGNYYLDPTINKNAKSIIIIGNIYIMSELKFNWLNKLMFKIIFNIKIESIKNLK